MTEACLIMTTCGSEETALTIAAAVVDQGLAACVSILPGLKSYYYFQGQTYLDEEVQLLIKTIPNHFEAISDVITELHTYEVPEILMIPVAQGATPFLEWIKQSVAVK